MRELSSSELLVRFLRERETLPSAPRNAFNWYAARSPARIAFLVRLTYNVAMTAADVRDGAGAARRYLRGRMQ